ncbi:putative Early meiotic induction protein 1 [Seiridium cardinale]|uniref:Early meiotic induction protein 1 n=1 Tax=Seiridium cardinale TaxID=138064 RepID=A0ABR2XZR2_9PEZI
MGWLWASSAASKGTNDEGSNSAQAANATPASSPPEPAYGDPEVAKFMAQIQAEFGSQPSEERTPRPSSPKPSKPTTSSASVEQPKPATESPWRSLWGPAAQSDTEPTSSGVFTNKAAEPAAPLPQHPDQLDPISESLLPTTMSCRNALDAAFYCQSPGGQWNAVYREGAVKSCSDHWEDLFFCMRTRAMSGKVKEEAIREHYRKKELQKYGPGRPNSTDVWESREQKVEPGTAFRERYDPPNMSDDEWWALEIRNRRAVQETLAKEKSS